MKAKKLEEYGPKSMPLVRSASMTDEQWAAAKKEIVAVTRRRGAPAEWARWVRKNIPTCRSCGTDQGPFGAASGLCKACQKEALAGFDSLLDDFKRTRQ